MKMVSFSTWHDGRVRMENTNTPYKHSSPQNVSSETALTFLVLSCHLWSYPLKVTLPKMCFRWGVVNILHAAAEDNICIRICVCICHSFIIKIVFESKGLLIISTYHPGWFFWTWGMRALANFHGWYEELKARTKYFSVCVMTPTIRAISAQ